MVQENSFNISNVYTYTQVIHRVKGKSLFKKKLLYLQNFQEYYTITAQFNGVFNGVIYDNPV